MALLAVRSIICYNLDKKHPRIAAASAVASTISRKSDTMRKSFAGAVTAVLSALLLAHLLMGCDLKCETGYTLFTGRYIRAADGSDLFFDEDNQDVIVIRDFNGDEAAFDDCSTGDLIQIKFVLLQSDEQGQPYIDVFEWKKKQSGTEADIPPEVMADVQERFSEA